MKVVINHPTGNNNVRALIEALISTDQLVEFGTTIAIDAQAKWLKALPNSFRSELLRRAFTVNKDTIWTHPLLETIRLLSSKIGLNYLTKQEYGFASIDSVYKNFDHAAAIRLEELAKKQKIDAVYGYEDSSTETFLAAKKMGIRCIYDLPIAYWKVLRRLLNEEAQRLPKWKSTLGGGINDSQEKLDRKTREFEMADVVVTPSQFVKDSVPSLHSKEIAVAPFGSPFSDEGVARTAKRGGNKKLRVLFAGSMGQRKGLGDLFEAMKLLRSTEVELVVMGSLLAPMEFYRKEYPAFTYEPCRSHDEVLKLMRSCDVFCLPSIVEGRALVMQEAMSQGLPIIVTENTGGGDLVIDGQTGFLVPIRNAGQIAEKLQWFIDNSSMIEEMGDAARRHSQTYTWGKYNNRVLRTISGIKVNSNG